MIEASLGDSLRQLREKRRISLRTLAEETGFSPSFLSQVENGQASPSISSLERIAGTLGVTLGQFFVAAESRQSNVVRVDDRQRLNFEWSRAHVEALSNPGVVKMQAVLITVEAEGLSGKHPRPALSDEFAYVCDGSLILTLEDAEQIMQTGDAVSIPAGVKRCWRNAGTDPVRILIVTAGSWA